MIDFQNIADREISTSFPYWELFPNGKLKARADTVDNQKHGLWEEYYESGKLKSKGYFWYGKKDSYWINYNNAERVTHYIGYDEDRPYFEVLFEETITDENVNFLFNFEMEFQLLRYEVWTATVKDNHLYFQHKPSSYFELEDYFHNLINKYGNIWEIQNELAIFHKRWYLRHFKENYYNCTITQKDPSGKIIEERYFKDGKELKAILYIYNKLTDNLYRKLIVEEEEFKETQTFYSGDESSYHFIRMYPNGKTEIKGSYNKSNKSGKWKYYDKSGKLIKKENYQ